MKYISTLIVLILFSFISTAQDSKINPILIIGKTIKIGNLEVAEKDFPNKMNWHSAKIACEALRNGWRLPTKVELNIMFQNKRKIAGFANLYYWSSTENDFLYSVLSFRDGRPTISSNDDGIMKAKRRNDDALPLLKHCKTRAVRDF